MCLCMWLCGLMGIPCNTYHGFMITPLITTEWCNALENTAFVWDHTTPENLFSKESTIINCFMSQWSRFIFIWYQGDMILRNLWRKITTKFYWERKILNRQSSYIQNWEMDMLTIIMNSVWNHCSSLRSKQNPNRTILEFDKKINISSPGKVK